MCETKLAFLDETEKRGKIFKYVVRNLEYGTGSTLKYVLVFELTFSFDILSNIQDAFD